MGKKWEKLHNGAEVQKISCHDFFRETGSAVIES